MFYELIRTLICQECTYYASTCQSNDFFSGNDKIQINLTKLKVVVEGPWTCVEAQKSPDLCSLRTLIIFQENHFEF